MKAIRALFFIVGSTLLPNCLSQLISCPVLTCDSADGLEMDQCYQHDDSQPVNTIRTFGCEGYLESTLKGTPLCGFSLPAGKHAWYHEST